MNNKFVKRLQSALHDYNEAEAVKLTQDIHEATIGGYTVSPAEGKLWVELGAKLDPVDRTVR
jgi:hypothetical protein